LELPFTTPCPCTGSPCTKNSAIQKNAVQMLLKLQWEC